MIGLYAIVGEAVDGWTCVPAGGVWAVGVARDGEPSVDETALREHDAVVREIETKVAAILPVRFGTVMRDEAEIARVIGARAEVLRAALATVRGRVQMTVRVFAEGATVGAAASAGAVASGRAYLEERAREARVPELDFVREAVAPLIKAEHVERHGARPLVGTVYHLIDRADVEAYAGKVRQIAAGEKRVVMSGPFPPYAFAPVLA